MNAWSDHSARWIDAWNGMDVDRALETDDYEVVLDCSSVQLVLTLSLVELTQVQSVDQPECQPGAHWEHGFELRKGHRDVRMAEATGTPSSADYRIVSVGAEPAAVVPVRVPMAAVPEAQRAARAKIAAALPALHAGDVKGPFTLWRPTQDGTLDMEAGVIVSQKFESSGEVVSRELPAGRAAQHVLIGGFEGLPGAWSKLLGWCADQKLPLAGINWEIYGEFAKDPSKQQTVLYALLA